MKWVEGADTIDGCFAANYWPDGKKINLAPEQQPASLSLPSLTDTPLQIMKLADFAELADFTKAPLIREAEDDARKYLQTLIPNWIHGLDQLNDRGFFAFPRPASRSLPRDKVFRLRDHVWIWSAFKSISALKPGVEKLGDELRKTKPLNLQNRAKETSKPELRNRSQLQYDYTPANFQRHVLRRFVTENGASKQRMLAVGRSMSYNRFMLHCKDTALLYKRNASFFNKSDAQWKATIQSQKYHKENQDSGWDNPLRYALALLMDHNGGQINSKPSDIMAEESRDLLKAISFGNGLFPGRVDSETKEPEIHTSATRDHYWHVTFETPFAIWQCIEKEEKRKKRENDGIERRGSENISPIRVDAELQTTRPAEELLTQELQKTKANFEMKKLALSNPHFIDKESIVDMTEEWLYRKPDFLDYNPKMENFEEDMKRYEPRDDDSSQAHSKDPTNPEMQIEAGPSAQKYGKTKRSNLLTDTKDKDFIRGMVIDIAKSPPNQKRHEQGTKYSANVLTNKDLHKHLGKRRTIKDAGEKSSEETVNAKKRIIWSPNADHVTGFICRLASPEGEKPFISSFFNRHFERRKYFADDVSPTNNVWRTEFHLSSYQLLDNSEAESDTDLRFLNERKYIRRGATGFLFVGDVFDRFWTCHILEVEPREDAERSSMYEKSKERQVESREGSELSSTYDESEPEDKTKKVEQAFNRITREADSLPIFEPRKQMWQQRKVLELLIFSLMLKKINERYKQMFEEIAQYLQHQFKVKPSGIDPTDIVLLLGSWFSKPASAETYRQLSKAMPTFLYTLQVMEEDLKGSLEQISLWSKREGDRQFGRPRWTKNDESRYRAAITKLTLSNTQKIRNMEHRIAQIQSFRTSLTSQLESTRNDLSFQSAENVRFFTTVTVIFLPLGFATGTFSMSGAPQRNTLWQMVIMAIVTLVLTTVPLILYRYKSSSAGFLAFSALKSNDGTENENENDKHKDKENSNKAQDLIPTFWSTTWVKEKAFPLARRRKPGDVATGSV